MSDASDTATHRPTSRSTWSWIVYDLANTIFALGVIGLYLPAWLSGQGLPDSALSVVEASAGVVVVFLAPWVGARSDARGKRIPTLIVTTLLAIAGTSLLASGPEWLTLVMLALALIAFNTNSVVYDALLPDVSTLQTRGSVSGYGVGIGYLGSFIGLGIGFVTLDVLEVGYAVTFRTLAAGFLLFSLPAFFLINERPRPRAEPPGITDVVGGLVRSWRRASTLPGMVRFLMGRFLYTDAINTLIGGFLALYATQELGLSRADTRNLLIVAIAAAIPGGLLSGRLVNRFGAVRVLRLVLMAWLVALTAGIAAGVGDVTWPAWVLAPLGGASLGATWAADRVIMIDLSPDHMVGEMYGLYATVGRFATILGPVVWALIVDGLGLERTWALGALALFVLAALVVISGLERNPHRPTHNPARQIGREPGA